MLFFSAGNFCKGLHDSFGDRFAANVAPPPYIAEITAIFLDLCSYTM